MTETQADRINEVTKQIIGAAIDVHDELGPGLLESAYEECMAYELANRALPVERQKALPIVYRGHRMDCGYRIDLLVAGAVIVELKSVEKIDKVHCKQLLSYLRLSGLNVGLPINFNVEYLRTGIKRVVNNLKE